jgi:hypothetical protein
MVRKSHVEAGDLTGDFGSTPNRRSTRLHSPELDRWQTRGSAKEISSLSVRKTVLDGSVSNEGL